MFLQSEVLLLLTQSNNFTKEKIKQLFGKQETVDQKRFFAV